MNKTVATFGTQWEADLAIVLLRQNGLHPDDLATSPHVTFAGADQTYRVTVPEGETEDATELLEAQGYDGNVIRPWQPVAPEGRRLSFVVLLRNRGPQ